MNSQNDKKSYEKKYEQIKKMNLTGSEPTLSERIKFIKYLIAGSGILPLINLDSNESTESFHKNIEKKTYNFIDVINSIGGKLEYIKSGSGGHVFKGAIMIDNSMNGVESKEINYALKVVPYLKEYTDTHETSSDDVGNIYNNTRPENAELRVLKILSQFVLGGQTPHIVLPIAAFNSHIEPFIEAYGSKIKNERYGKFVKQYKENKFHDIVSILITEWANGKDLLTYVRNNIQNIKLKEWKVIFFQILSVFAIIQNIHPSFRHNDAKANNFLVHNININNKDTCFKYIIGDNTFIVPYIGYQIKMTDYDFSSIQDIVENAKVNSKWANNINISSEKNRYYDICYFFASLQHKSFIENFRKLVPQEVINFIDDIVPLVLYDYSFLDEKRGRLLIKLEYTTPEEILVNHPFFNKFKELEYRKEGPFIASGKMLLDKIIDKIKKNIKLS